MLQHETVEPTHTNNRLCCATEEWTVLFNWAHWRLSSHFIWFYVKKINEIHHKNTEKYVKDWNLWAKSHKKANFTVKSRLNSIHVWQTVNLRLFSVFASKNQVSHNFSRVFPRLLQKYDNFWKTNNNFYSFHKIN